MDRISLLKPGELLATIPALLGFAPTNSAVIVCLTIGADLHFGATIRIDLPHPRHATAIAKQLATPLTHQTCNALVIAIIGGTTTAGNPPRPLPHQQLVTELEQTAITLGIHVDHALWIHTLEHGQTWHSYHPPHRTGTLPNPHTTDIATLLTANGHVIHPDRETFANQLAPHPRRDLTHRKRLLRHLPPITPADGITLIHDTINQITTTAPDEINLDNHTIARLTQALTHRTVCRTTLTLTFNQPPTTAAHPTPAEHLWTYLTRATPAPQLARPATLLATSAYLRGNGPLAGIALDTALTANPHHKPAHNLRTALDHGLPPHQLQHTLTTTPPNLH